MSTFLAHAVHILQKNVFYSSVMAGYGAVVRKARDAEGLTQTELAEEIGLTRGTIGHIENERTSIDGETFVLLTNRLRALRPTELLAGMGYPIGVPGADQLPKELIRALLPLTEDDLLVVLRLARGLQQEPAGRR